MYKYMCSTKATQTIELIYPRKEGEKTHVL